MKENPDRKKYIFQASLSPSLHIQILSLSFRVPHLLCSRLYSPMFSEYQKKPKSCEILAPKIQQVMCLPFSSYSISILSNYSNFWIWHTFPAPEIWIFEIWNLKPLNIQCFWFSLLNQVCFRICNSEIFSVLACYYLQLITQNNGSYFWRGFLQS